jgi:UDP-glucose 4-epimerase
MAAPPSRPRSSAKKSGAQKTPKKTPKSPASSRAKAQPVKRPRAKRPTFRVALTGACSFLGERFIAAMENDPACEHVLAMDIARPNSARSKTRYERIDLTNPAADEQMAELLERDGIDTLLHLAFLAFPSHARSWAHEVEAIGSLYVMNAAASAKVQKVIMASTMMVYGAYPNNPNYLTEDHRLRGMSSSRWVMDKVAAERELARLKVDAPEITTTSLRFGIVVGPESRSFFTRVFSRDVVMRLMGYDPLMQFLHEDDAVAALLHAQRGDYDGAFNVVGQNVLYFSDALSLGGRIGLPVPYSLVKPTTTALWGLQFVDIPGSFLDFFRYAWCGDDTRMREVMGFTPRFTSREALLAFFEARERRRTDLRSAAWGGS